MFASESSPPSVPNSIQGSAVAAAGAGSAVAAAGAGSAGGAGAPGGGGVVIVIPARYGSVRFPGKPLAKQTGKYLIQHVVEQAVKARRAQKVVVATDDHRIFEAVRSFGGQAVMTSDSHHSGTDRIAEVMRRPEYLGVRIVVNVQGDEPDIEPGVIDGLIGALEESDVEMATAAAPFATERDVLNPNLVKVVVDQRHYALYFSRAVVPFDRDRSGLTLGGDLRAYRRHLGIYAYRREALLRLAGTPVCELERIEKLEQLRALYLGMKIFVQMTAAAPHGVDTPEDYAAFVKRHNQIETRRHEDTKGAF